MSIFRSLNLALLMCVLASCEWVDSTGVQPGAGNSGLEPTILTTEETRTDLNFSVLGRTYANPISVEGWERISEGVLEECSSLTDLEFTANSLQEACSPTEDSCELAIVHSLAANGEPDSQLISIFPPQLSKPVGVRYRWYLRDGLGDPQNYETTLCIEAVNNVPTAQNDEFTIQLADELRVDGIEYDVDCRASNITQSILSNDLDDNHPGSECLTAELIQAPSQALNDFVEAFTPRGGFTYIANPERTSPIDSFTYRVFDGSSYSERATVTLVTDAEVYRPIAVNDTVNIGQNTSFNLIFPLLNDSDPFGSTLSLVAIESEPNRGGTVTINQAQSLVYTPPAGYRGNETFFYRVRNVYGLESTARVLARVR